VVDGSDEVVYAGVGGEGGDELAVGWAQPFALESDEDVDLRCVGGLEARGFAEVGFVAGKEDGEGAFRIVELSGGPLAVVHAVHQEICFGQ
jgi:hypothetical protein